MNVIKTEKAYGVAGKSWAAINNGRIVKIIPMNGCPSVGIDEAIKASGKKRDCPAARRMLRQMEQESFEAYRTESRNELSKLGNVVTGVASCGEFVY